MSDCVTEWFEERGMLGSDFDLNTEVLDDNGEPLVGEDGWAETTRQCMAARDAARWWVHEQVRKYPKPKDGRTWVYSYRNARYYKCVFAVLGWRNPNKGRFRKRLFVREEARELRALTRHIKKLFDELGEYVENRR